MKKKNNDIRLAIIGLGYVVLPLALEFSKKREVIGFDINQLRVDELKSGIDKNKEFTKQVLLKSKSLKFTLNNLSGQTSVKQTTCRASTISNRVKSSTLP